MKKINVFLGIGLLAGSLLLSSCQGDRKGLQVGIMPDLDSIPFAVAKQMGYFEENVEIQVFKSPVDRDAALQSGSLDGSISDVLAVCLAREGGFNLYITSQTNGGYGLVTHQDSGIKSPKDLEGRQIGLSLNTIIEYVADSLVAADGGDPALLHKTPVPKIPSRLELIQNKQIDAVAMPEPYVTAAEQEGNTVIAASSQLNINPGVFLFKEESLKDKEAAIQGFYGAYNKAVEYIASHDKNEFMPGVIEELGLPETVLHVELPSYQKYALPGEEEVNQAQEWLVNKKMISFPYGYSDLIWEVK